MNENMANMSIAAKKAWKIRREKYGQSGIGNPKSDRKFAAIKAWEKRIQKYGPSGRKKDLTKNEIVMMLKDITSKLNTIRRSLE